MLCEWCHMETPRPHNHPLDCVRALQRERAQIASALHAPPNANLVDLARRFMAQYEWQQGQAERSRAGG